jgi:type IX secretion system substrate protein
VTCKEDGFDSNVQLYVVIVEKMITAYTGANGSTSFRNVVLDILPSSSGELLGNEWEAGVSSDLNFNWIYEAYMEDLEDLMLVAFVFDRDKNRILQSSLLEHTPSVGLEQRSPVKKPLAIYPNPAGAYVYINFGEEVEQKGTIAIVDLSGRIVATSEVFPSYTIQRLDISDLTDGIYMIQWLESGLLKGRNKLVRSH